MALLTEHNAYNRKTSQPLAVDFVQSLSGNTFTLQRNAQKVYSYIGMTKAAAEICMAIKKAQYYRLKDTTIKYGNTTYRVGIPTSMADIKMTHMNGLSYDVNITVTESDSFRSDKLIGGQEAMVIKWKNDMATRYYDDDNSEMDVTIGDYYAAATDTTAQSGNFVARGIYNAYVSNFATANMSGEYRYRWCSASETSTTDLWRTITDFNWNTTPSETGPLHHFNFGGSYNNDARFIEFRFKYNSGLWSNVCSAQIR